MASVASDAAAFASALSSLTGLDGAVILAWMASEQTNIGNAKSGGDDGSSGAFENWLNIGINGPVYRGSDIQAWQGTPQQAAQASNDFLHDKFSGWSLGSITGGAILASAKQGVQAQLAAIQNSGWISGSPGVASYPNLLTDYNIYKGANLPPVTSLSGAGGSSLGTTGTSTATKSSSTAPFYIGGQANPSEDVWTGVNRLAQQRYWFLFSDGEVMYLADGTTIMLQKPALTLDRWSDLDRIVSLTFSYDNSAFQYTHDHKHRGHISRRTQLAKVSSPVEAELNVIDPIDGVRAGDVVQLSGCGPGDGRWLVGTARRSIFSVYSELTLVPAVKPLTEAQIQAGLGAVTNADFTKGSIAGQTPGTVIHELNSTAATIADQGIPYVNFGGHQSAGHEDIGAPGQGYDGTTKGYDSAGCVAADLAGAGLISGKVGDPLSIIAHLQKNKILQDGRGSGTPEYSLFNGNGHFFVFINATGTGRYWGAGDGEPLQQPSLGQAITQGGTGSGAPTLSGGTWLNPPSSLSGYQIWHIDSTTLRDSSSNFSATPLINGYANPFGKATIVSANRIDMGVDYTLSNGDPILAIGDATILLTYRFGAGNSGWPGNSSGGGGWVSYRLTSGPYSGKMIYVAEGVDPIVNTGQTVQAGQQIATYVSNNSNLETGWASGVGTSTLCQQLGQESTGSVSSTAGVSFNNLLKALHVPGGSIQGGPVGGPMPAGYP